MNGQEQDYLIPFKDTIIKCCKCYVDYWKSLRGKATEYSYFKFDYSIEKVKSFRKFVQDDKTLFHFCIDCFNCIMIDVPISLVEFEIRFRRGGGCIANALMGNEPIENICNGCINFVIEKFSEDKFIIV